MDWMFQYLREEGSKGGRGEAYLNTIHLTNFSFKKRAMQITISKLSSSSGVPKFLCLLCMIAWVCDAYRPIGTLDDFSGNQC